MLKQAEKLVKKIRMPRQTFNTLQGLTNERSLWLTLFTKRFCEEPATITPTLKHLSHSRNPQSPMLAMATKN